MKRPSTSVRRAFSLIEVVIATAVFATAIVAIIGLMSPLSRRVEDVIDSEVAGRLAESIQTELARIGFGNAVTLTNGVALDLVATVRGDRVLLSSGASPPADRPLNDTTLPGMADRDRFFAITITRQFAYDPATSGSLALRADVSWPFQVPVGPASGTTTAHGAGADPATTTDPATRQTLPFFFALTP